MKRKIEQNCHGGANKIYKSWRYRKSSLSHSRSVWSGKSWSFPVTGKITEHNDLRIKWEETKKVNIYFYLHLCSLGTWKEKTHRVWSPPLLGRNIACLRSQQWQAKPQSSSSSCGNIAGNVFAWVLSHPTVPSPLLMRICFPQSLIVLRPWAFTGYKALQKLVTIFNLGNFICLTDTKHCTGKHRFRLPLYYGIAEKFTCLSHVILLRDHPAFLARRFWMNSLLKPFNCDLSSKNDFKRVFHRIRTPLFPYTALLLELHEVGTGTQNPLATGYFCGTNPSDAFLLEWRWWDLLGTIVAASTAAITAVWG